MSWHCTDFYKTMFFSFWTSSIKLHSDFNIPQKKIPLLKQDACINSYFCFLSVSFQTPLSQQYKQSKQQQKMQKCRETCMRDTKDYTRMS